MQPLDSDRRAFRMVGGVLVERTVGEVLPVVIDNRKKVSSVLRLGCEKLFHEIDLFLIHHPLLFQYQLEEVVENMKTILASKQKEMAEWKAKYNIRAVDEQ